MDIIEVYEEVVNGQLVTVSVLKYEESPDFTWEYCHESISGHPTQFWDIQPDYD